MHLHAVWQWQQRDVNIGKAVTSYICLRTISTPSLQQCSVGSWKTPLIDEAYKTACYTITTSSAQLGHGKTHRLMRSMRENSGEILKDLCRAYLFMYCASYPWWAQTVQNWFSLGPCMHDILLHVMNNLNTIQSNCTNKRQRKLGPDIFRNIHCEFNSNPSRLGEFKKNNNNNSNVSATVFIILMNVLTPHFVKALCMNK